MMVIEQRAYEAVISAALCITENLPRVTKALESIAADLSHGSTPPMCEAEPDDLPF
jgi:hypothetical protein